MKYQILTLFFIVSSLSNSIFAQEWSLAKEKNGVKVYTRKIEGWGIKEYKAEMTVKSSFWDVVKTLKDVRSRSEWLHNTIEIREIGASEKDLVTIYTKVDAPWPVADRDNITRFAFSYPSANRAHIKMTILKSHEKAPIYSGVVRVERLQGHWIIQDKGNGYVSVVQQCVAEPGGSLPDWVVNSAVVDTPLQSMSNLKTYLEKG
ncbi:START domain-containing protein [Aureispira anguillae]|uniref:START domain-containing protein n=1 Tax=Aureispira anguillae TaxID=2864201 RepID=A0A916DWH4_9BACT|nr:START domain-containing protein [Aureispira anguillae]BDS14802.1 START domain-containing protein [Aureispira anguillae]